jgi:hypothetical protein
MTGLILVYLSLGMEIPLEYFMGSDKRTPPFLIGTSL